MMHPRVFEFAKFHYEAWTTCLFEEEAPNLAIPFATRPYNKYITGYFRINEARAAEK